MPVMQQNATPAGISKKIVHGSVRQRFITLRNPERSIVPDPSGTVAGRSPAFALREIFQKNRPFFSNGVRAMMYFTGRFHR